MRSVQILLSAFESLKVALAVLAISVLFFGIVTLAVKGREAIDAAFRAIAEVRLNLAFYFFDALFVAPVLSVVIAGLTYVMSQYSVRLAAELTWTRAGRPLTFIAVLFIGDFISYWRHRVEHTRWFWPAHIIHHSDTDMTWLTQSRFHPINRMTTAAIDAFFLALLGFPTWALIANNLVRHYYGEFIHADLSWMYGSLRRVFVSPVMHRWHHARDITGSGSNFATVFSVFDRAFGTYYVPGPCNVPLGVTDDQYPGPGIMRHLMHPFTAWAKEFTSATRRDSGKTPKAKETEPIHQPGK